MTIVSVARSLGFAARINEVDGKLQYHEDGDWHEVRFAENRQQPAVTPSLLRLDYVPVEHYDSSSLPVFVICDTFNRVLFVQQGYTINLGEQLLKVIGKL